MGVFHETMTDVKKAIEKGDYDTALKFGEKVIYNISKELGALIRIMEKWNKNITETKRLLELRAPKEEVMFYFEHCIIAARDAEKQIAKLQRDLKV